MLRSFILAAALLLTLGVTAHEFWLEPVRFVVAPGSQVYLGRWVGDKFSGERWSGRSARLEQLRHYEPGGRITDLTEQARRSDSLQTTVSIATAGTHLLAFRTNDAQITLPAEKFEAYLQEEGLTGVQQQRARRKQTDKPGREAYRRCAKTLLQAGPVLPTDTAWRQPVGHPLEIVLEQNPYALRAGASLTARVLVDGRPAAYQTVQAWLRPAQGPAQHLTLRANNNGRVLLRLQQPATVLLGTVRMVPHATPATADWHSTWATFTFAFLGS
jgi:uncharacterized GH25 family protein